MKCFKQQNNNTDTFTSIAKKNKRKNWIKWTAGSVLLSLLFMGILTTIFSSITSRNGENIQNKYLQLAEIAYPNVEVTSWGWETTSDFSGKFYSNRIKDIDGISTNFVNYHGTYSISGKYNLNQDERVRVGDDGRSLYTHQGNYKIPKFYSVNQPDEHETVTQDLTFIPTMSNQAVEVAITFNKGYTLAEIDAMLPDNLKLNWIWIGDESGSLHDNLATTYGFTPYFDQGLTAQQQAKMEEEVDAALEKDSEADVTAIYEKYQEKSELTPLAGMQNSYTLFQEKLKDYLKTTSGEMTIRDYKGKTYSNHKLLNNYLKANKNPEQAKFAGIILTGKAENFTQLQNADWIYASNIGQSVVIQPYHHLDVE